MWYVLFIFNRFLTMLCPFSDSRLAILNIIHLVANWIFIVLTFFLLPHWYYGLGVVATNFLIIFFSPRIDPYSFTPNMVVWSKIGSLLNFILHVAMWICLLKGY